MTDDKEKPDLKVVSERTAIEIREEELRNRINRTFGAMAAQILRFIIGRESNGLDNTKFNEFDSACEAYANEGHDPKGTPINFFSFEEVPGGTDEHINGLIRAILGMVAVLMETPTITGHAYERARDEVAQAIVTFNEKAWEAKRVPRSRARNSTSHAPAAPRPRKPTLSRRETAVDEIENPEATE